MLSRRAGLSAIAVLSCSQMLNIVIFDRPHQKSTINPSVFVISFPVEGIGSEKINIMNITGGRLNQRM